ncbi:TPA: hypothetical protein U6I48_004615 [Klebsiella aerogenes]|nr:hypothetical protein [Klebsiella aerogenes]
MPGKLVSEIIYHDENYNNLIHILAGKAGHDGDYQLAGKRKITAYEYRTKRSLFCWFMGESVAAFKAAIAWF